jgi:hypothetical protein
MGPISLGMLMLLAGVVLIDLPWLRRVTLATAG